MYRAKERGKNQYQFFADEMKVIALQRMTIESGLRLALDAGHFTVVYQPKIELGSQRLIGAEALLRWDDPSLGPVSPTQFIPIAEHCGLINAVGDATIKIVLDQMRGWYNEDLSFVRSRSMSPATSYAILNLPANLPRRSAPAASRRTCSVWKLPKAP